MSKKTRDERMSDTLAYLKTKISPAQYQEIERLVPQKDTTAFDQLSDDLSIGNVNPFRASARRAKRSLMLLASLFIEDAGLRRNEVKRVHDLPDTHESDRVAEIKSWFIVEGVTDDAVATLARRNIDRMPNWNNVNVEAAQTVRGVYNKTHTFNCYNACVFWAFQAGAISKRFLWNKLQGKDGNTFFPIYSRIGWTTILEKRGKPPVVVTDRSVAGDFIVPAGLTVYFETPSKVFGHVALSLGDGTVISQNSVIPARMDLVAPEYQVEVDKMTRAITHIISIRQLVDIHFHIENAYPRVKITRDPFYDAFPIAER